MKLWPGFRVGDLNDCNGDSFAAVKNELVMQRNEQTDYRAADPVLASFVFKSRISVFAMGWTEIQAAKQVNARFKENCT